MIWWIDFLSNLLLCLFFLYLVIRPILFRKPFVLSSAVYCSMVMLGLLLLSLQDYIVLSSGVWNNFFSHWKGLLFILSFPLYILLIPRMKREFYIFHISESVYREKTIAYLRQEKIVYSIDPSKLSIKAETDPTFYSYYNPQMRYAVWVVKTGSLELLKARQYLKVHLANENPSFAFTFQIFSFFLIFSILLLRIIMIIAQRVSV